MLFVLENIVKRLTWLILLAFPALVCAQEGSEPPGDTEVVPAVTAGEDDEKSGDAPQEPGGADRQQDEKEKDVDEDNPADWPGLLACCGLSKSPFGRATVSVPQKNRTYEFAHNHIFSTTPG